MLLVRDMIKVNCPNCAVRLTASDEYQGQPVICQKCGAKFILAKGWTSEPIELESLSAAKEEGASGDLSRKSKKFYAATEAEIRDDGDVINTASTNLADATLSPQPNLPTVGIRKNFRGESSPPNAADRTKISDAQRPSEAIAPLEFDQLAKLEVTSRRHESADQFGALVEATSLLDIFDIRFRRCLTPKIIRFSWCVVLLAALLGAVTLTGLLVASLLPPEWLKTEQVDIASAANGANFQFRPEIQSYLVRIFHAVIRYAITLLCMFMALLWLRVICESVMTLFRIAKSLDCSEK